MPSTERTAGYLAQTNASQPSAIETIPTSTARQHLNLATKVQGRRQVCKSGGACSAVMGIK